MGDKEWADLFARLHREAKLRAKHEAKVRKAGYSNAPWRPEDARRKPRGMAAQVEEG